MVSRQRDWQCGGSAQSIARSSWRTGALIDFIAGYYATQEMALEENATLLPLTQRATQTALERVFVAQAVTASLVELRKSVI